MTHRLLPTLAALAAIVAFGSAFARAASDVKSLEEATKLAAASGKPVLVDASADW